MSGGGYSCTVTGNGTCGNDVFAISPTVGMAKCTATNSEESCSCVCNLTKELKMCNGTETEDNVAGVKEERDLNTDDSD